MMTKRELNDDALELCFESARAGVPDLSSEFLARLQSEAVSALAPAGRAQEVQREPGPIWLALFDAIGGRAGLGGLITATVIGFWVGISPPEAWIAGLDLTGLMGEVIPVDEWLTQQADGTVFEEFGDV